jgi:AcrR family transcriptional regulator
MVAANEPAVGQPGGKQRAAGAKRPAHRPSRRRQIIDAATAVFAREGYVEASVEDIAKAAGVAPTAIYYHFGGKEELFIQALRAGMEAFSEAILHARPDTEAGTIEGLRAVLRAGWNFWQANPNVSRLVSRYSEGSTVQALQLRREWEERHLERAYDYVAATRSTRSTRKAREQHAAHAMTMRVMLDVILVAQAAALDGAFGRVSRESLIKAVEEMCVALIESLR